jgi:hypothetical protein
MNTQLLFAISFSTLFFLSCNKTQTYNESGPFELDQQIVMTNSPTIPGNYFVNIFSASIYGMLAAKIDFSEFKSYQFEYVTLNSIDISKTHVTQNFSDIDSVLIFVDRNNDWINAEKIAELKVEDLNYSEYSSSVNINQNIILVRDYLNAFKSKNMVSFYVRFIPKAEATLPQHYNVKYNFVYRLTAEKKK